MNEEVVKHMVIFIEEAEKALQTSKVANESKSVKIDIVNSILEKLEKETKDEN